MTAEHPARVLVVDDHLENLELATAQLRRAGLEVLTAANGPDGLACVAAEAPDVILLDIMMPGMDGFEVLRQLRADVHTRGIPVIVMTALQERSDKLRALELGANDFLTKPVDRAELLARVRNSVELRRLMTAQSELLRMKDELVSVVSHELRTPLASVVGFAELLLTQNYDEPQRREFLTIMHQEGRRLTALINDFLDLQRMESQRQSVHAEPVALGELLRRAIIVSGEDPQRPIVLDAGDEPLEVEADADRVVQVLVNLLSNARKYSPKGGTIRVSTQLGELGVRVLVQDNGLGLPPEAMPHLFNKFYRVDNSDRRSIGGTGLGLAICRQIISEHGGRIGVTSDGPGKGSTFWFTLPLSKPNPEVGDVLIVEDDAGFSRLLDAELAALGLSSVRVANAEHALERLANAPPKAMVLDLLLPGISGEQLFDFARHARLELPPVVVVTVRNLDPVERLDLEGRGVVAVFTKGPYVATDAAACLADVISGNGAARPTMVPA